MFIAQSTIQMRSVGAPVRKVINEGFRYDLEQKPAVAQLLGHSYGAQYGTRQWL